MLSVFHRPSIQRNIEGSKVAMSTPGLLGSFPRGGRSGSLPPCLFPATRESKGCQDQLLPAGDGSGRSVYKRGLRITIEGRTSRNSFEILRRNSLSSPPFSTKTVVREHIFLVQHQRVAKKNDKRKKGIE